MIFYWLSAALTLFYYAIFYRYDILRIFHPHRRWGWNSYYKYFGMPHNEGAGYVIVFVLGIMTSLIGDFLPTLYDVSTQFAASFFLFVPLAVQLGPPAVSKAGMHLKFPRQGVARFSLPKGGAAAASNDSSISNYLSFFRGELTATDGSAPPRPRVGQQQGQQQPHSSQPLRMGYVSLVHAHLMAQPVYEPEGAFMNALVSALERTRFAWVQFLFQRVNLSREYASMRYALLHAPDDGSAWSKMAPERIKAINTMISGPLVALSIRMAWRQFDQTDEYTRAPKKARGRSGSKNENENENESPLNAPFDQCVDALDSLTIFETSDTRLLAQMQLRYMDVADLKHSFARYNSARVEPPAFVLSADKLPFFIHLPSAGNVKWIVHADLPTIASWENEAEETHGSLSLKELDGLPRLGRDLTKEELSRLAGLAANHLRTFEIVRSEGKTRFFVSGGVEEGLANIYGALNLVEAARENS